MPCRSIRRPSQATWTSLARPRVRFPFLQHTPGRSAAMEPGTVQFDAVSASVPSADAPRGWSACCGPPPPRRAILRSVSGSVQPGCLGAWIGASGLDLDPTSRSSFLAAGLLVPRRGCSGRRREAGSTGRQPRLRRAAAGARPCAGCGKTTLLRFIGGDFVGWHPYGGDGGGLLCTGNDRDAENRPGRP